jgi:hypothetical protein
LGFSLNPKANADDKVAEPLAQAGSGVVDLASNSHPDTGNRQSLVVAEPAFTRRPEDPDLRAWLEAARKPGVEGCIWH